MISRSNGSHRIRGMKGDILEKGVYPQILHYGLKPVDTIMLREAQFNLAMKPATYSMAELRDRYTYLYKYMRDSATAINQAEIDR